MNRARFAIYEARREDSLETLCLLDRGVNVVYGSDCVWKFTVEVGNWKEYTVMFTTRLF